jgi:hypothetical protein
MQDRIDKALGIIEQSAMADASHRKQRVLDQVVRALTGPYYDTWIREFNSCTDEEGNTYNMRDTGIAP